VRRRGLGQKKNHFCHQNGKSGCLFILMQFLFSTGRKHGWSVWIQRFIRETKHTVTVQNDPKTFTVRPGRNTVPPNTPQETLLTTCDYAAASQPAVETTTSIASSTSTTASLYNRVSDFIYNNELENLQCVTQQANPPRNYICNTEVK